VEQSSNVLDGGKSASTCWAKNALQRASALGRLFELHLGCGAMDRAPVLMVGDWHAAFDADSDPLLWRFAFSQQSLQE
jgi:hypothetical protein